MKKQNNEEAKPERRGRTYLEWSERKGERVGWGSNEGERRAQNHLKRKSLTQKVIQRWRNNIKSIQGLKNNEEPVKNCWWRPAVSPAPEEGLSVKGEIYTALVISLVYTSGKTTCLSISKMPQRWTSAPADLLMVDQRSSSATETLLISLSLLSLTFFATNSSLQIQIRRNQSPPSRFRETNTTVMSKLTKSMACKSRNPINKSNSYENLMKRIRNEYFTIEIYNHTF